jgi:hypothetical protein
MRVMQRIFGDSRGLFFGPLCAIAALGTGCGASLQAVYEGDVRFERCMALDTRPDVKPAIRRECWTEWVSFYTYGQTRDRLVHAHLRIRQLGGNVEGNSVDSGQGADPTSLLMPVSMSNQPDTGSVPGAEPRGDAGERCSGECRDQGEDCTRECRDMSCQKGCSAVFESCLRRCG